ncbi:MULTISPECIES: PIN domain-containing protein [Thiorhodovibrio]|uniref:PIN domain-containing protein n=1 Tax=Thiorhodovibrio TaxID=61593 RepID=UPI001912FB9E|nr:MULTISPECIES: PIN domain-containing protein [Thiorhodovibrio]MBK5969832.1 VapC toxin family PIN domain ribonuclease [Thiorhodovibrio winogradskyi]WPL12124.1 VapC-mt4 [Thiorhodovibrio litoralis]
MGLIIDTGVLIRVERSTSAALDFSPWQNYGDAAISVVTASELLVGVHRSASEGRRICRSASVETMLAALPILDVTLEIARVHAELVSAMRQKGLTLGANDAYIAATALASGHALLTTDVGDFSRVPGLEVLPFDQPVSATGTTDTTQ